MSVSHSDSPPGPPAAATQRNAAARVTLSGPSLRTRSHVSHSGRNHSPRRPAITLRGQSSRVPQASHSQAPRPRPESLTRAGREPFAAAPAPSLASAAVRVAAARRRVTQAPRPESLASCRHSESICQQPEPPGSPWPVVRVTRRGPSFTSHSTVTAGSNGVTLRVSDSAAATHCHSASLKSESLAAARRPSHAGTKIIRFCTKIIPFLVKFSPRFAAHRWEKKVHPKEPILPSSLKSDFGYYCQW